jgi:thermitase
MGRVSSTTLLSLAAASWLGSPLQGREFVIKVPEQEVFEEVLASLKEKENILDIHQEARLILVDMPENQKNIYQKSKTFSYLVPNITFHTSTLQDPLESKQWSLPKVNAAKAWTYTVGSPAVTVAVIDTGVDWNHEDLKDRIWSNPNEIAKNGIDDDGNGYIDDVRGWDFHGNDSDPMDETSPQNPGHGTHCAGIIAASGPNGIGILGMGPELSIMPIRFLGADGSGDLMAAVKAIDYAVAKGAQIISASWGAAVPRQGAEPILEAIQRAETKGVIFIAAASNDGASNDTTETYPANAGFSNVISVAASDSSDKKPTWSNYGRKKVDLASPGAQIHSTLPKNTYGDLSGTSMATPLVSGLVGLLVHEAEVSGRTLKPEDYKAILQSTGAKVDIETACQCRVDAGEALDNLASHTLTLVPNAGYISPQETLSFKTIGNSRGVLSYTTSNPEIGTIDSNGLLTGKGIGEIVVTVKDEQGNIAQTHPILITDKTNPPPGGGGDGTCPFEDPFVCQILCLINPKLPWCTE